MHNVYIGNKKERNFKYYKFTYINLLMELQCQIERDREKGRHMHGGGRITAGGREREHINVTMCNIYNTPASAIWLL